MTDKSLGTEIIDIENAIASSFSASIGVFRTVWIQIMQSGYEEFGQQILMDSNKSFYALLVRDLNT